MPAPTEPTRLAVLHDRIGTRLDNGALPAAGTQKIFGGYGDRQLCAGCDERVLESDVLYEVEVQQEREVTVLCLHRWCFDIWMEESLVRRRRGA